ncbi:MAG TPA: valine--tRNA ligase [Terriglobales bacterium]|jgi:valyl-tRNA synthetase|nr:valine--tRNA ligase [Terriglobales bacterium]
MTDNPKNELPKSYEPGAIEARWADEWVKEKLFSVATPAEGDTRPVFTLLLPPPNVTGRLHMGHMLNQTQMDIIVRWHRMRGFVTLWLPGTDHAGIATQMMVERQLASEHKRRTDLGREKFIERVWEWKKLYGGAIQDQMRRLGASVDWDREYFTMDENLSRAVREVFVRLYEQGLIYRGKYIVNWCPRCATAISDLEVKHEEVPGKLWEIRYPVVGTDEFITVATTRPETMLGDTAIAVNERDERYTHLHGKKVLLPLMNREIPIITDELAQPEFGTGAVKVTPAHDANDFVAGLRHNLPQIEVMDEHARMNQNAGPYAGLKREEARKRILADLREQGFLTGEKDYTLALGTCDRCGSVVEPRLSTQWFIKIQPLAARAIEVVEKDDIRFTPANYRQIYLNWMRNIHDWCISRQLWWGHQIPAWYCDCGEIIVAREAPSSCPKCGSSKLKQDPDVLDTWFSSGLLPFTALGWPEATRDLEVFYPTSLLITGFDILFFWVARMIMLGCWFMAPPEKPGLPGTDSDGRDARHPTSIEVEKQEVAVGERASRPFKAALSDEELRNSVPFRDVYIHALVRDADRQKMSKTKGNVLDPIQVIEKYGTDATRFTLAAMSSPGTDIAFNEKRTEGYRAFANKIWNAARFMFMNIERIDPGIRPGRTGVDARPHAGIAGFQTAVLEDRWILSRFNSVTKNVNGSLTAYRFDEAANAIYDFFWGELCDWYLELIKARLLPESETARGTCANLVALFEASLRLLHPVMPFITEEIWHAMYDGKPPLKSLALAEYPQADEAQIDRKAEAEMAILQDLIASVRNLRAELKVETKQRVPVEIFAEETAVRSLIEKNAGALERLANVEQVRFVTEPLASKSGARGTARFDLRLIYEQTIDVAAECVRLKKEMEKIEKGIAGGQRQLGNEQFLAKAPAQVVENLKKQQQELAVLHQKTQSKLNELGCGSDI